MTMTDVINKLKEPHRLASLGFGLGSIIAGTVIRKSDFGFVLLGAGVTAVGMSVAGLFNPVDIPVNPAHVPEIYRAEDSWRYGAPEGLMGSQGLMTAGGAAWNVMRADGTIPVNPAHVPEIYRAEDSWRYGTPELVTQFSGLKTSGGAAWSVNRAPVNIHTLSAVEGSGSVIGQ